MPLGGEERRLRESGERDDNRRRLPSVRMTRPPPPAVVRLLTDRSTGSIWIGGHSACFCITRRKKRKERKKQFKPLFLSRAMRSVRERGKQQAKMW